MRALAGGKLVKSKRLGESRRHGDATRSMGEVPQSSNKKRQTNENKLADSEVVRAVVRLIAGRRSDFSDALQYGDYGTPNVGQSSRCKIRLLKAVPF